MTKLTQRQELLDQITEKLDFAIQNLLYKLISSIPDENS